jgi:ribosomal-protein-alanine N-acetyltransferase
MLLRTRRLDLLPCSFQVAQAVVQDRDGLKSLLGVRVPDDWPAQDLQEFLPTYAQQLQADPTLLGWGIWLMIHRAERTVIGDLGFKGRPDDEGTVEIGYSVVPAYRRQGFASEAVRALVDWALAQQGVRGIIAECSGDNTPSIRILEKVGMRRLETAGTLLRWELGNKSAREPQ